MYIYAYNRSDQISVFLILVFALLRKGTNIQIFLFESKMITNQINVHRYFSQPYIHVHIDVSTYINKYSLEVGIPILLKVGIFFFF